MKTALFSDIHANWDALKTAVEYAEGQGIRQFAVLGDSIGYGANPNECLDWVLQHALGAGPHFVYLFGLFAFGENFSK